MRFSFVLAVLGAALALASPLSKKGLVWDMVTEYSYVTVVVPYVPDTSTPTTTRRRHGWNGHGSSSDSAVVQSSATPSETTLVVTESTVVPSTSAETPVVDVESLTTESTTSEAPIVTTTTTFAAPTTTEIVPVETTTSAVETTTSSETLPPVIETASSVPETTTPTPSPAPPSAIDTVVNVFASSSAANPTQAAAANPSAPDTVEARAIDGHNSHRPQHSAPIFTWNETLAAAALEATSCEKFAHILPANADWGQNIYASFATAEDGFTTDSAMGNAAQDWYNEISLFDDWGLPSPPINTAWLHFTQMVWISSHSVGCAVQTCGTDNTIKPDWYVWYVTCNYYPVGNIIGLFDKNVKED